MSARVYKRQDDEGHTCSRADFWAQKALPSSGASEFMVVVGFVAFACSCAESVAAVWLGRVYSFVVYF